MTTTNWIVPHAQRRGAAGGFAFPASSSRASTSVQPNAGRGQTSFRPGSPVQEFAGSSQVQMQEEEDLSQTQYSPPLAPAQQHQQQQQQQQHHYVHPQYPYAQAHPSPPAPSQLAPVHSQSRRHTSFARPPSRAATPSLQASQNTSGTPQIPFYSILQRSKTGAKRAHIPIVSSAPPLTGSPAHGRPASRVASAAPTPPSSSQAHMASMLTSLSNVVTVLERQSQSLAKLERALGESAKAHDVLGERFDAFGAGKQESEQKLAKLIIDGVEQQRRICIVPAEEARQAEAEKRSERERERWTQNLLTEVVVAVKREISGDAGAPGDLRKDLMTLRDGLQESLATLSRKIDTVATNQPTNPGPTQGVMDLLEICQGIAASQQALRDRLPQDIENAVTTALKPLEAFLPIFQSNLAQQQAFQTQLFDLIKLQMPSQPAVLSVPEHVPERFELQTCMQVPQAQPQYLPAARPPLSGACPRPSVSQQQRPPPRNPHAHAMHDRTQTSNAQDVPTAAILPAAAHDQHLQPAAGGRALTSSLAPNKIGALGPNGRKILPLQRQVLPPSDHQVSDISSAAPSTTTDFSSPGYHTGLGAHSTAATELIANSQIRAPTLAARVEVDVSSTRADSHAVPVVATLRLPDSHARSDKQQQPTTDDLPARAHSDSVRAGIVKLNDATDKENEALVLSSPLRPPPGTNSTVAPSMNESQLVATYARVPALAQPVHTTSSSVSPAVRDSRAADYAPPTPPVSSSPSTALRGPNSIPTVPAPIPSRPAKIPYSRKRTIFQYSSATSDDEEEVLGTDHDMRCVEEVDDSNAAGIPVRAVATTSAKATPAREEVVTLSRHGAADSARDKPGHEANNANKARFPTAPVPRRPSNDTDSLTSLDSGETSASSVKGHLQASAAAATTTKQIWVEPERVAKRRAMPDADPQPAKHPTYALTSSSSSSEEADDMADEDYSEQRHRKAPLRRRGRLAGASPGAAPVPAAITPSAASARGGACRAIKGGGAAQRKKLPIRNAK